jgi:hypothetical protein
VCLISVRCLLVDGPQFAPSFQSTCPGVSRHNSSSSSCSWWDIVSDQSRSLAGCCLEKMKCVLLRLVMQRNLEHTANRRSNHDEMSYQKIFQLGMNFISMTNRQINWASRMRLQIHDNPKRRLTMLWIVGTMTVLTNTMIHWKRMLPPRTAIP